MLLHRDSSAAFFLDVFFVHSGLFDYKRTFCSKMTHQLRRSENSVCQVRGCVLLHAAQAWYLRLCWASTLETKLSLHALTRYKNCIMAHLVTKILGLPVGCQATSCPPPPHSLSFPIFFATFPPQFCSNFVMQFF
jgi:hypothetical protein